MEMLEKMYKSKGAKAKFSTTEFSFNQEHQTLYELNFEKMLQVNSETKKKREIRRRDDKAKKTVEWEWWNDTD